MSCEAAPPVASDADAPPAAEDRTERYLRLLEELAELAMTLVRRLVAGQLGEAAAPGRRDISLQFCRYAKVVRHCFALSVRIEADLQRGGLPERRAGNRAGSAEARGKGESRSMPEGTNPTEGDAEEREASERAAVERLDATEFGPAWARQPIGVLVEEICRTLGVGFDAGFWADADPRTAGPAGAAAEGGGAMPHDEKAGPGAPCGAAERASADAGEPTSCGAADPAPVCSDRQVPCGTADLAPAGAARRPPSDGADKGPPDPADNAPWDAQPFGTAERGSSEPADLPPSGPVDPDVDGPADPDADVPVDPDADGPADPDADGPADPVSGSLMDRQRHHGWPRHRPDPAMAEIDPHPD